MKKTGVKLHRFLFAGELVFTDHVGEQVSAIRLNTLVESETKDLPASAIGRAQQALQMLFFKRMGKEFPDVQFKVLDVVIISASYIGQLTVEEFHAAPEGTKLQEQVKTEVKEALQQAAQEDSEAAKANKNEGLKLVPRADAEHHEEQRHTEGTDGLVQ